MTSRSIVRDSDGKALYTIGQVVDITEAKIAQDELVQASKLATLGEMATGMAHELNQPLQIIRIAADHCLIKIENGMDVDRHISSRLEKISNQTSRMAEIIDHMRVFGRVDDAEVELFDAARSAEGAVKLIHNELNLADIEVKTRIPKKCSSVKGHPIQLEQVILNLLANAKDAIETDRTSGSIKRRSGLDHIGVSVKDDSANERVQILVSNDGTNIPNHVMERIFDPFFTTKEAGKGLGLGLSVSYGIIDGMGGNIFARNTNAGVEFEISLPIATGN